MSDFAFWLIAAVLLLIALAFVLLPLLKSHAKRANISRKDINKAIYHGKVEDLQSDLDKGLLDQDEYAHALSDLQQTLLQDAEISDQQLDGNAAGNRLVVLALCVTLPLLAFILYDNVSTGQYTNDIAVQQPVQPSSQTRSLESSIASLEQKLKDQPDNVQGWKMLGQSYFVMQRYESASQAYKKALGLDNQTDPELLVLAAEASAFANNELFSGYEKSLLRSALSINPNHQRALWYSGYAAYTSSNFKAAADHWQDLLALVPTDQPKVKESLLKFLNDARKQAGLEPIVENNTVAERTAEAQSRSIKVSVQLAEKVNQQANSSDALFIYARPAEGAKMPLSLARMTVASLPTTVTLTKDMAMMPSMTLSSFDKVEVLARISKSGQAITQKGDLISQSVTVDFSQTKNADVSLDINSIVE